MPIRQGKAKLWFNTKEEQDEYDDKMIASVQLQSPNYDDQNFTPVFSRKRQQFFLQLSDEVKTELSKFNVTSIADYADKYHLGKRDHTFWRAWTVQKFGFGYALSYLLLRQLPIRNFYARAWIMLFFAGKVIQSNYFGKGLQIAEDQWNNKQIKNYGIYNTMYYHTPPTLDGKLPEQALWKMNQPGYLRPTPHLFVDTAFTSFVTPPKYKVVEWDGTFNMPLQGLASPKHKDAKWLDFIYQ